MYADNLYLVICAILCYILVFKQILYCFRVASGLVCAWHKTIASAIPARPPPVLLWLLPWQWEDDLNASKLLGAPTARTIAVDLRIGQFLLAKLES